MADWLSYEKSIRQRALQDVLADIETLLEKVPEEGSVSDWGQRRMAKRIRAKVKGRMIG